MAQNDQRRLGRLDARIKRIDELLARPIDKERKAALKSEREERALEQAFLKKRLERAGDAG